MLLYSVAMPQVQGETLSLTPFTGELGTHLVAMPTYTYSRSPGTLGYSAEEETWTPDKWKNRRIFERFVPIMDWEIRKSSLWFYAGNEIGDLLWQELNAQNEEPNRTPMLYGGFATQPLNGFYATAQFNQIDHFSEATMGVRKQRINSQKFSWFGENLPAYSGLFGGFGYIGDGDLFKSVSILTGSEYVWAWNEEEWVPIRISPRIEWNASIYFMEREIEFHASTEKFQIQDSVAENHNNFGMRLKGKNTGSGLYVNKAKDEENMVVWADFAHDFFGFANKGFIAFSPLQYKDTVFISDFADSLEYKTSLSEPTDLTLGVLLNLHGAKLYGETAYNSKPLFMKVRAYQSYSFDFESVGLDSEIAYRSRIAEAGVAYSREFFDYYRSQISSRINLAENSAKLFLKYRFLQNLSFTHEWVYRDLPSAWFWNAQIEQKIPKLNAQLYAVWLNALSKDNKDFPSFGGVNRARFYCGINALL